MKKSLLLFVLTGLLFGFRGIAQQKDKTVLGTVSDGTKPLQNVEVSIKDSEKKVFTDENGKYEITTATGQVLVYRYTGLKPVAILVEDVTRILNITMFPDVEELDEVVVTKSRRKSKEELEIEYPTNPNLIRTAYGILDAEASTYQIRVLPKESITQIGLCILNVIRNEFPGVAVFGNCIQGGGVIIRGRSSIFNNQAAIFDVDGQVFTDTPLWILPDNMERVAVLNGLQAVTLYGSLAAGGVVIVNTKVGNTVTYSKELKDKARLRNNYLKESPLTDDQLARDLPSYLQQLYNSPSLEEAKSTYMATAPSQQSNPGFFIEAYRYFSSKWKEGEFADSIIGEHKELFSDNPLALKSLAYAYQEQGDFRRAHEVIKETFILRPHYAQSYLDLARSYRDLKNSKRAASIYARYYYLVDQGFINEDTLYFSKIMDRELNNLLALGGEDVVKETGKLFVEEESYQGTRLVFEWDNSDAEFELQFVNPDGQYYTWKHSLEHNNGRIQQEKSKGFSIEEYLLDRSTPGPWSVNIKYLGNKSLTPTYIKSTVYHNYGEASQRKEVKLTRLHTKGVNKELLRLNVSRDIVRN
ncbi:TonB-dependent receptor plug domain-containing protein [Flavobacteriaceae bacterium TP-CH-4]|uniref:TonB-dependent receptor plug domain-containing protein n=1 Tax=Pelagihabitans pacificus TaxID=2696054 RepID=A0A967ATP1_9FLAO|nr:carboxypeptidase-like regulatory domain-containing protein [Pelagihabitans pacificus]NHF59225.1 TonB-dependent receptor plug domain-containing protein [Pelagihabitans pacificus]